ncbi:Phage-related protein [uncultured Clostridium sp.]|nr:Phage-related protein [uncultured Clostridium sp.]
MGQADGTILIDTSISDDGLVAGTKEVEAAARRMAESVSGIGDKAKIALQKQADSFAKLNSQYDEQTRKVEELKSKVEELKGEKIPTQEYTDLNKEIDSVSKKLDAVIERQIKFVEIGGNRNSQTFKAMEYDIDMLRQKLEEAQQAKAKLESSGGAYTTGIDTESGQKTMAQYTSAQAALENTLNRLKTSYADLNEKTKEYNNETKKASKSTGDFQKNLGKTSVSFKKMLSYAFGIRSLFALFNRIRSAVTDGMKNLVQYSGSTNSTVSGLMGSLTQLKNALATAFAPILTAVAPALNYLISLLTTAATVVGQFFSALTGQSTFVKATKVQENYADSLKKTGSAAKKAEKSLASFDTIEQIGSKSSDSGGGGGSSTNPKDMFTTEQISSSIKEMADKIRQMVAAEDWQGVGNYIGSQIGNGVNFGMSKLDQFLSTTNWKGIGTAITAGLTGFFSTFSWSTLSSTVSHFISGAVQLITGLFKGVDWRSIPQGIIDAIGGILKGFDYASVFGSVGELIGTAIASGIDLLKGLGDVLVNSWNSVVSYFSGYIDASGGDIVLGLYNGIVNALKSVGSWIVNNIFKPFINGFKSAFGIHSPSTVMMEMGQYLMEGLRNGISNFISSVITKFAEIKDKIITKWDETKQKTQEKWSSIKSGLESTWTAVKTSAGEKFQAIKETVSTRWNETKSSTESAWGSIHSTLATKWEEIRSNATAKFTAIKDSIVAAWKTLKSETSTIWNGIWGAMKSVINTILGGVESMVNGVINALNKMISALNNLSFDIPDWIPGIGGESFGLDIPTVSKVHLPRLASGTVVPPRAGEFAAILGDNKRETEVVSPLSTMKQALMEALAESGISGGSQQVVIRFEGNLAQLGRVLKPVIDSENNRTGVRLVTGGSR